MIVLGLTGSVGMGKSMAAAMLLGNGVPVYDSDAAVHRVLGKGGAAVPAVDAAFPGIVAAGAVDRNLLGKRVFRDDEALVRLEAIVHPLVREIQDGFLKRCARRRVPVAALDVPLLFEIGLDARCDVTVVVSAPPFVQAARVLGRPGMTGEKFRGILARQLSDAEKRRRADFVVPSGAGKRKTLRRLAQIVRFARTLPAGRWPPNVQAEGAVRNARSRPRYGNHRP